MNRIKAFGGFWYEFIVGDDWRVGVAVVAALAITAGVATTAIPAWWVLPAWPWAKINARYCPRTKSQLSTATS